jgi:hypothetical protein
LKPGRKRPGILGRSRASARGCRRSRRKRRGSDKPIITPHRIHGCLLIGCFVGSAAMVEPPGKPGGSDKPLKRAVLDALLVKRWGPTQ